MPKVNLSEVFAEIQPTIESMLNHEFDVASKEGTTRVIQARALSIAMERIAEEVATAVVNDLITDPTEPLQGIGRKVIEKIKLGLKPE